MSQILWRLGQTNVIDAVTVAAAAEVVSVRLGVSPVVFLLVLRREGHGTAGGVEDSLGNPSGTLTLTRYDPLAQLEALG